MLASITAASAELAPAVYDRDVEALCEHLKALQLAIASNESVADASDPGVSASARFAVQQALHFIRNMGLHTGSLADILQLEEHVGRLDHKWDRSAAGVLHRSAQAGAVATAAAFERDCNRVLEMVARNDELSAILDEIVTVVERQGPGRTCAFFRLSNGRLHLASGPNLPADYGAAASAGIPISPDGTPCGAAAWTKAPVVASDLRRSKNWPNYREIAVAHGINSCCCVPVLSGSGEVLGTISAFRQDSGVSDTDAISVLQRASRLVSVAVEHRQLYEKLRCEATTDRVTGLPNKPCVDQALKDAVAAAGKKRKPAVIWINLDRFNEINGTLGHKNGDTLLRQVAERLSGLLRGGETLGRASSDEFLLLIPDASSAAYAESRAQMMLEAFGSSFSLDTFELFLSASIGIAIYPEHGRDAVVLEHNANSAMYAAKTRGRRRYCCYNDGILAGARDRLELETDLRRALSRNELEVYYQPQVDLNGNLKAMEALLRWKRANKGILTPASFITIAEETGLIVPIGAWVVREACRQAMVWRRAGLLPVRVAVNVSAMQIYFGDFVEEVRSAIAESHLAAGALEIELTESTIMRNSEESSLQIQKLRELGISVSIDDFGTGYSSLSYLQALPVDQVKIDRSFLQKMPLASATAVVKAITALAHSLGLTVVAEGIEREDQMEPLRAMGVDLLQGYLVARPMPAEQATQFLKSFTSQAA